MERTGGTDALMTGVLKHVDPEWRDERSWGRNHFGATYTNRNKSDHKVEPQRGMVASLLRESTICTKMITDTDRK